MSIALQRTRFALLTAALLLMLAAKPAIAQTGELNLLTDLGTPFPPGCLAIDLPDQPRSQDSVLVNQDLSVPSLNSDSRDATINVLIWRAACADEGFSVVLVRLQHLDGPTIMLPHLWAEAGDVSVPGHAAKLLSIPASGPVSATGEFFFEGDARTWMLAVEPVRFDNPDAPFFLPENYNETFTLELTWESLAPAGNSFFTFLIDRFEPAIDPPQFDAPVLNGRYSGQWTRPGAFRQGLVLQIAEQVDSNFVFAIFFTYLNGEPTWLVGNTTPAAAQPGPVSIDLATLENGAFITSSIQPPVDQILGTPAGTIEIEPIDCNTLRVAYDFTPLGQGTGEMQLQRLVRIAGYDCNPWQ